MSKFDHVTASEIGEYTYCPRGWWLRFNGLIDITPQMKEGSAYHNFLGTRVLWIHRLRTIAIFLLLIGLVCLLGLMFFLS